MFVMCGPSEPAEIKIALDAVSEKTIEDDYGADYFFWTGSGMAGVQRKKFPGDFFSSMGNEGRLQKDLMKLQHLPNRMLLLEGLGTWTSDGKLQSRYTKCDLIKLRKTLWTFRQKYGVVVEWTHGIKDTIKTIQAWQAWLNDPDKVRRFQEQEAAREKLRAFEECSGAAMGDGKIRGYDGAEIATGTRPGPPGALRRKIEDPKEAMSWIKWILQGMDRVGPKLADKILEICPEPLEWKLDLEKVPGIGKEKAQKMRDMLKMGTGKW